MIVMFLLSDDWFDSSCSGCPWLMLFSTGRLALVYNWAKSQPGRAMTIPFDFTLVTILKLVGNSPHVSSLLSRFPTKVFDRHSAKEKSWFQGSNNSSSHDGWAQRTAFSLGIVRGPSVNKSGQLELISNITASVANLGSLLSYSAVFFQLRFMETRRSKCRWQHPCDLTAAFLSFDVSCYSLDCCGGVMADRVSDQVGVCLARFSWCYWRVDQEQMSMFTGLPRSYVESPRLIRDSAFTSKLPCNYKKNN